VGEWERGRVGEWENCPITNSQFPMPNAQFPMPNFQFPIPNSLNIHPLNLLNPDSVRVAEIPSRIKFQKELEFACEF
jgi:hypothetical protein